MQVANLGAKIQNYQSQRAILLALFNKATTVKSAISVQQVLSNVQSQIDQLQSQQRYLASRISQAAISITFVTHKPSTPLPVKKSSTTNPVVKAIERAGTATINVVAGVILLIGYALPLAILGLIGWGILVSSAAGSLLTTAWHEVSGQRQGRHPNSWTCKPREYP